jgi:hypothetical protein
LFTIDDWRIAFGVDLRFNHHSEESIARRRTCARLALSGLGRAMKNIKDDVAVIVAHGASWDAPASDRKREDGRAPKVGETLDQPRSQRRAGRDYAIDVQSKALTPSASGVSLCGEASRQTLHATRLNAEL